MDEEMYTVDYIQKKAASTNLAVEDVINAISSFGIIADTINANLRAFFKALLNSKQTGPSPSLSNNWNKMHGYVKIHRKRYKHQKKG